VIDVAITVRRARVANAVVFAVHGAVYGSFAARIPWIQERLHLDPASLGVALLMPALGAISAMPFAGRLIHSRGTALTARLTMPMWCAALIPPAYAPDLPVLCLALFVYGATSGVSDVAMNAQGVEIEERMGRSIMSSLHGMWSVGGLAGGAIGALAAYADTDARAHLTVVGVALAAAAAVVCRLLLTVPRTDGVAQPPIFAFPARNVVLIGAVGFCAVFAESAAADWCAVYLRNETRSSAGTAATAYGAFAFAMASMRLTGDRVVARFGPVTTVRVGALVAAAGGLMVVALRSQATALIGFALIGVGIATAVPLAFAAAGRSGGMPAQAIAGVATLSYGSGLAAPAAVGAIADATSLRTSFALVTALILLVGLGAGALRPASAAAVPPVPHPVL
jgi:MFS family permease